MNKIRRLFTIIGLFLLSFQIMAATDFSYADKMFIKQCNYLAARNTLDSLRNIVSGAEDRSELLWRLSRVYLVLGEQEKDRTIKHSMYSKGESYAQEAIDLNPKNPYAYMWHCASVGRNCQLKPLMEQAKSVPIMINDLTIILNDLSRTDISEAWQALAEIYFHHPFKSNDCAINFMRKAISEIPADELRLSSYIFLSDMLVKRDWSAEKRKKGAQISKKSFDAAKDNIEKYSFSDCRQTGIGSCSDREEAVSLLLSASTLYKSAKFHSPNDIKDYEKLKNKLNEIKR